MNKKRVDQWMAQFFPELSRSKIQSLIQKGKVSLQINGQVRLLKKVGEKLEDSEMSRDSFIIEPDEELNYVSRGALKLKKALDEFSIDVSEKTCLDVGLSTGGFSDLLLKRGAKKIMGVDVGQNQLHTRLKEENRLLAFDKINARNPLPDASLRSFFKADEVFVFDLIVVDISFISLSLVLENLLSYLKREGCLICLVKPQFELTRQDLNKKGVVKEVGRAYEAVEKILGVLQQVGIKQTKTCESPIEGDDGNKEFLLAAWRPSSFDIKPE